MIDLTELRELVEQYDWEYEEIESGAILTSFLTEYDVSFPVVLELMPPWIRMEIPLYMPVAEGDGWGEFAKHVLQLNYHSRMARFALNEQGDLVLCLEIDADHGLPFETFALALDALSYIAEMSYPYLSPLVFPGS